MTQQIHSLRASGVISSQAALATGEEVRTFRKSAGTLCGIAVEICFLGTVLMPFTGEQTNNAENRQE